MPTEPLPILPSGRYVVMVDVNGNTVWLEQPTVSSFLQHDGDQFYWADGSVEKPLHLDPELVAGQLDSILGVEGGIVRGIVNDTAVPMMLVSQDGAWQLQEANVSGLPTSGFGVAAKTDVSAEPSYITGPHGVIIFDENGVPLVMGPGANGSLLTIVAGAPQWSPPNSGAISTGISATGLDGVLAQSLTTNQVKVKAPTFNVSNADGSLTRVVSTLDITVDMTVSGVDGKEPGLSEDANAWYYVHVIANVGGDVAGLISDSETTPDLTGLSGPNGPYTMWGVISVFRNNAASNIVEFVQRGRRFSIVPTAIVNNGTSTTALAPVPETDNDLTSVLPPIVKTCSGNTGGGTAETGARIAAVASSASGIGLQTIAGTTGGAGPTVAVDGFEWDRGPFQDLIILNPADMQIFWKTNNSATSRRKLEITGYTI